MILKRRIHQKNELRDISSCNNETLTKIINAFQSVRENKHQPEDILAFSRSEKYRESLLKDETEVTYEVFSSDRIAKVKNICKIAASRQKWCQFLYKITQQITTPKVLEIGTNLGVSGTYILEAIKDKGGRFITMEGLPKLCEISGTAFSRINSHFEIVEGLYETTFPVVLEKNIDFNVLFIDGNHRKEPTLHYFQELKRKVSSPAIFIFDDIYWSNEMKEAWTILKNDKDANFSIDLYEQGIIIIDKNERIKGKHFSLHLSY